MDPINQTNPEQPSTLQPQSTPQPVVSAEPQSQTVSQSTTAQPVVSAAPQPIVTQAQPASVLPPSPVPQYPAQPATTPKKHKKGLIIGIVIGAVVVVLAILVIIALPAIQRQALASNFIDDVTAGKIESAVTRTGDATSKTYLTTAATKLKGETAKFTDSKYNPDSESYYLFDLSGGTYKSARVSVTKEKGKLVVASFVYDTQQLKLVPSSSKTTSNSSNTSTKTEATTTTTTPTSTATQNKCLVAADFISLSSYPLDPEPNGTYVWRDSVFFNADAATYAYADIMPDKYTKYKTFYGQESAKDFTIQITGQVNSTASDATLATARATKVQTDLENLAGIPASRIVVNTPSNYGTSLGSGDTGSQNRNVDIKIASSSSCVK